MLIAISSKFIHIFFSSLCKDKARMKFWLERIETIDYFKVYGSIISKNSIQYKLDPKIINRHFEVVNTRNENCALQLCIKDYVLVEFSGSGALYAYKKGSINYNMAFKHKIDRLDDLKLSFLGNLVDIDFGQMYMNDEGRMVHSGNWQYRLEKWLRKMTK